jgi:hypothetical protein
VWSTKESMTKQKKMGSLDAVRFIGVKFSEEYFETL